MDSQHRPDLEQNDLEAFLANAKRWWAKYGTWALLIVIVLVGALFLKRRMDQGRHEAQESAATELASAATPQSLEALAAGSSDPNYRALAYLRAADMLRQMALLTPENAPAPTTGPADAPATRKDRLDQAERNYRSALAVASAHPLYRLNARLGLGSVLEDRGDWDGAAVLYEALAKEAGDRFRAIATQARARAALLPELRRPPVYAPEPPPATRPASPLDFGPAPAPQTQPASPFSVPPVLDLP